MQNPISKVDSVWRGDQYNQIGNQAVLGRRGGKKGQTDPGRRLSYYAVRIHSSKIWNEEHIFAFTLLQRVLHAIHKDY